MLSGFPKLELEDGKPNFQMLSAVAGGLKRFLKHTDCVKQGIAEGKDRLLITADLDDLPASAEPVVKFLALKIYNGFIDSKQLGFSCWDDAVSKGTQHWRSILHDRSTKITDLSGTRCWKKDLSEPSEEDLLSIYDEQLDALDGSSMKDECKQIEKDISW